ncbi:Oxoglutarate and iron-dependent oxygenase degradation C-term-domain-containing protein [Scheffersomyces coipomensis]|uniref:Oxoglutarate and iron-dependent oxygenase degradation C-term-domain-containing protein n=1 Tax=Scheffersomyces coipomensis TaxID=1788519 RepID=UPI00315D69FC
MTKRQEETQDSNGPSSKKLNINFNKEEIKSFFNQKIFDETFQDNLQTEIKESQPYRWGHFTELVDDTLLRQVRTEVLHEIAFTKKETDIYKVFQSGDLANLSGLNWDDLSKLPSLYKLRSAIYSQQFRDIVSKVCGCGKLSGVKTDMSINVYNKGCHLLTHDDVIDTRRVSFILYMPEPDKVWHERYGGSLRLFDSIVPNVPQTDFYQKFTPQFNQMAFFTVQPGLSFHDVEEVREDRKRLSIQGWFHIPQPGEDGFIEGEEESIIGKSTLQLLQSKELQEFDFPKLIKNEFDEIEIKHYEEFENVGQFTKLDIDYLSKFINKNYLNNESLIKNLSESFLNESILELKEFLNEDYASTLRELIRHEELNVKIPIKVDEISQPWKCAIPPHKHRFLYIDGKSNNMDITSAESINFTNSIGPQELPNFSQVKSEKEVDNKLIELSRFLKSIVFKKWLKLITNLVLVGDQVLIRRFRPGSDFILATKQTEDLLLEATLNLTPSAINPKNWESGEFGGYELCMSSGGGDGEDDEENDEEDDPAIYRSNGDDSVLFTNQCQWNSLTLVLRDSSVLKFIKYVSINAKGSRWDISCQWNIQQDDDEEEDEEEEEV